MESHIGLPSGSRLLPLPVSLPLSVCLSEINKIFINKYFKKKKKGRSGIPGWRSGLVPPSARGLILETGIESRVGLPAGSLLLPLCLCLSLS